MSHYMLYVTLQKPELKAIALNRKIAAIGLKHERAHDATKAAEELSSLPGVKWVTLILVNETSIGVWRKGKKS